MNELANRRNKLFRNVSLGVVIALLALALITVFLAGISLPLIGGLVVIVGLLVLIVRRHAMQTTYTCPSCRHRFKISAWTDFLSPHFPGKKLLVCPQCDTADWCRTE